MVNMIGLVPPTSRLKREVFDDKDPKIIKKNRTDILESGETFLEKLRRTVGDSNAYKGCVITSFNNPDKAMSAIGHVECKSCGSSRKLLYNGLRTIVTEETSGTCYVCVQKQNRKKTEFDLLMERGGQLEYGQIIRTNKKGIFLRTCGQCGDEKEINRDGVDYQVRRSKYKGACRVCANKLKRENLIDN